MTGGRVAGAASAFHQDAPHASGEGLDLDASVVVGINSGTDAAEQNRLAARKQLGPVVENVLFLGIQFGHRLRHSSFGSHAPDTPGVFCVEKNSVSLSQLAP